ERFTRFCCKRTCSRGCFCSPCTRNLSVSSPRDERSKPMTTQGISLTGVPVSGSGAETAELPQQRSASPADPSTVSPTDPSTKVFARRPALTGIATDLAFVVIAVLDVWLVVPEQAPPYSVYLSAASCVALLLR